jgi:hypothetical protein
MGGGLGALADGVFGGFPAAVDALAGEVAGRVAPGHRNAVGARLGVGGLVRLFRNVEAVDGSGSSGRLLGSQGFGLHRRGGPIRRSARVRHVLVAHRPSWPRRASVGEEARRWRLCVSRGREGGGGVVLADVVAGVVGDVGRLTTVGQCLCQRRHYGRARQLPRGTTTRGRTYYSGPRRGGRFAAGIPFGALRVGTRDSWSSIVVKQAAWR